MLAKHRPIIVMGLAAYAAVVGVKLLQHPVNAAVELFPSHCATSKATHSTGTRCTCSWWCCGCLFLYKCHPCMLVVKALDSGDNLCKLMPVQHLPQRRCFNADGNCCASCLWLVLKHIAWALYHADAVWRQHSGVRHLCCVCVCVCVP